MSTIVHKSILYLAPNIGTILLMVIVLWYFSGKNEIANNGSNTSRREDNIIDNKYSTSDQRNNIPIISSDACFYFIKPNTVIIKPCSSGDKYPTKESIIDRSIFDLYKFVPLMLVITVPTNMIFENLYLNIVYSGYAKQYYFPNISDDYDYVFFESSERYIGPSKNYARHCVGYGYFNYKLMYITRDRVAESANACIVSR